MRVTFLGTGTSQGVPVVACKCDICTSNDSHDKRLRSSVYVEVDGYDIVIDSGPDFRQQMLRANVTNLDAILLTHEHYDHIAGLDDIRAFNWVQKRPSDIYAEEHVVDSMKRMFSYVFAEKRYPGVPQVNIHKIDYNHNFFVGDVEIIPIRAFHYKLPVLGFRIHNFAYLTDIKTISDSELHKLDGVDTMVINALRMEEHLSHLTVPEALAVIEKVKPRRAYLTHIGHQLGRYVDVQKIMPEGVFLAYDELSIEV